MDLAFLPNRSVNRLMIIPRNSWAIPSAVIAPAPDCATNNCGSAHLHVVKRRGRAYAHHFAGNPHRRSVIGSGVPQRMSQEIAGVHKVASARNGVFTAEHHLHQIHTNRGMLAVVMVCRPGPKASNRVAIPKEHRRLPFSDDEPCDPMRKSPAPCSGIRCTISCAEASGYSMTSRNSCHRSFSLHILGATTQNHDDVAATTECVVQFLEFWR